mmetsp:Transcript_28031/g.48855  ORF Transcript_28031/g.48855 Transcript_28031/m.48855 type:complete len:2072 (-) Transcript_28031:148-6363(-)
MAPWGSWSSGNSWGNNRPSGGPRQPSQPPSGGSIKPGIKPTAGAAKTPTSTAGTLATKTFGNKPSGSPAIKPTTTAQKPGMPGKPGTTGAKPPSNPPPGANKPGSIGIKRPGGPEGAASGSAVKKPFSPSGKDPAFTVSTNSKKDEIGIQTLVGTYTEIGSNHGRKYYQKIEAIPGHQNVKVFLYYWDNRDGADFSGWWFGDELGGSQVWARCSTHGPTPPRVGWKIPWDAPRAEPGILFVDPYKKVDGAKGPSPSAAKPTTPALANKPTTPATSTATPAALAARVKKATTQVETAEKSAKMALDKAKPLTADSAENLLKTNLDAVTAQQTKLNDVMKSLTQDITETRKGGPSALTSVTELSKLSPRIRTTLSQLTAEVNKIKGFQAAAVRKAEQKKKDAENAEKLKKQEGAHLKEFQAALPPLKESVSAAEDTVEAVHIMAQPLVNDPPEEPGEAMQQSMGEVEKSAAEAQTKLNEARQKVTTKLTAAKAYAPEARKKAVAEFSALQDKLSECQKKLNPYKNFKKEFQQRVEAKKALVDISEKIAAAELEVEKATMMSDAANQGQMSEDEVKSSEELVSPAQKGLTDVTKLIDTKMKTSSGFMKDELMLMKTRLGDSRKKLEGVTTVLKHQREGIALQQMAGLVTEKVDAAEESLQTCQEAEMPFLKGIEVLPKDESDKAIGESETAAAASNKLLEAAKSFLKGKLGEARRYSKEASKAVIEELNELQQRVDEVGKKLDQFKKETAERKTAAIMAEVLDAVAGAERKAKELTEAATIFGNENIDELVVDDLKAATEKCSELEKEVSKALQEARSLLAAKQKTAKGGDLAQALSKVNARVNGVQNELTKSKKAAANGDKLIKGKTLLVEEGGKIKEAEESVAKAEGISKPAEGEKLSDENIKEMDAAMVSASKVLKSSQGIVSAQMNSALQVMKKPFTSLVDRCKKALATIDEVKAATKDQRETVMSEVYVQEGKSMSDDIVAAMAKVNEAELPFLKGIEVLDLKEATDSIKESEEAAAKVQKLISEVRGFLAAKNIEVKGFKSENAKDTLEEFTKLTEKVNTEAGKLSQFRKDTEVRKKATQMQEAGEKITTLEAEVEKVTEATKPFATEEPSEEDLSEQWKTLSTLEKETKAKADEAKNFLNARLRDAKGNEDKTKYVNDLNGRLATAISELTKAKKVASTHEQKFKAKALLEEAAAKITEMDDTIKLAAEFCAPLVEEGGEKFLISARKQFITDALKEHMQEKETSLEDLLTTMGGADGKVPKEAFIKYLTGLPEAFSNEALTLTEERSTAIFEQMDVDKDGHVSVEDFKESTKKTFTCVHGISVTDVCDISTSKTVTKLEVGDKVESHGVAKKEKDKADSLPRLHVKLIESGKEGWVTMAGNAGTTYLQETVEINAFVLTCDAKLKETTASHNKIISYFSAKTKELQSSGAGPLSEAKAEMLKHQQQAKSALKTIEDMKRKVGAAKRTHALKVEEEANAHIVAKEKKEADAITEVAKTAIAAMDAELKKLEEAAAPLISLKGDELLAFPTPVTIQEEAKALVESTKKLTEEAKTATKEAQEKVAKATKGPLFDAKKELGTFIAKSAKAAGAANQVQIGLRKACATLADTAFAKVQTAMREDVQKKSVSLDDLWGKLSTAGEERITEENFCKHIASLEGITLHEEHAQLVTRKLETGGIGRRAFMAFLQQYYVVVKEIAITSTFEINTKDKPIRRAELEEVFEVLEGPTIDEKIGLERVRAKSMNDGAEGWISVKGNNQGKIFLTEVEKPFYVCTKEFPLQTEFKSGSEALRTVKVEEVLELIEGPRKETFQSGLRVRGKASLDGKTGWFTIKDKHGAELAAKGNKHYTCTATVAMTDTFDIKTCKVTKKLSVDEVFTLVEGPEEDKDAGLIRVKGKSSKDDAEGWVTVKGNAGTVYAKVNEKLYTVEVDELPLQSKFPSGDAATVRTLAKGEAIEALEGPKEEKFPAATRLKCRTSGDNAVGWLTMEGGAITNWSGSYKVVKAVPMHETKSVGETSVRELEAGEKLDLLEGPLEEAGAMRMKCRAKKDNAMGWVSFKDADGNKLIQS